MADSTYNNVPETRGRWWALAGLFAAAAGVFTFFVSRMRRAPQASETTVMTELSVPQPPITSMHSAAEFEPPIAPPSSPWRTLAFLAVTVLLAVAFIVLQNSATDLSTPLFVGLVIGAVLLALANAPAHIRGLLRTPIIAAQTLYHQAQQRIRPVSAFLIRYRFLFAALSTLVAFVFMIQSTMAFQLVREEKQSPNRAITLMVYGIVAVGVAVFCARPTIALPTFTHVRLATFRPNRWLMGSGIAVLLLLSEINGKALKLDFLLPVTTDVQFALLVIGLILLALGLGGLGVPKTEDSAAVEPQSSVITLPVQTRLTHYGLLALIILLAFFARFFLLNDIMRFLIDEESFILATHYLRAVPNMEILAPFSSIAAFPYVFPYWQMLTINLFGPNLLGLRATSAILGALGVAALYLLARTLFDRKTALLAALILATFPPHVQFSRIGISEIASPLFATLAFTFLARGLLHGRRMDYAVAGVMLGLTHYFHEGGRLLYTPIAIAWVIGSLIVAPRPSLPAWIKSSKLGIGSLFITVIALIITAAPIYYTLVATGRPLFARMVSNGSGLNGDYWRILFETNAIDEHIEYHVLPAFLVYVNQLDNTFFYADGNAFVLPVLVPFFLFGIAYAIWRWRAPGMILLLLWPLSTSVGNSLMVDSAGSPRYIMVFPVVALIIAVGLRYSLPLIVRQRSRLVYGVMTVIAVGLALFQLHYYFNDHMVHYSEIFRGAKASPDGYDAALRSLDFPLGTTIHIISLHPVNQLEAAGLLHLSRPDLILDAISRDEFTDEYIDRMRCRLDHAFFIERTDFQTLDILRDKFYLRDPQFTPYDDFLPAHQLVLFYAPYIRGSEAVYGRKC